MFELLIVTVIVVVAIVLAAVLSASVTASALVSSGRILRLMEAERAGSVALDRLMDAPHRFRGAAAFASGLAYVTAAASIGWAFFVLTRFGSVSSALIGAGVGLVVVFTFSQALPKAIAVQNAEGVALAFAPVALRLTRVLYGPAKLLSWVWIWLIRLVVGESAVRSPWMSEDEYRLSTPDDEESVREVAEEAWLEAVSDFAEKVVREVMVPRTDMTCVEDTATAQEAIALIEGAGYSRLPVYRDTLDDIVGVLYAKDLLAALGRDRDVSPVKIARRPYFVPETKPVQELLIEMRARTHIAIVADEYGGTAGLVTIEDLLEEIVGEIFDEYDLETLLVTELGGDRFLVDARLPVDDLNERFDTAIESEADTVGGVVIEAAGRIPVEGDVFEIEGLRFIVEDVQGTRIRQLVVESASLGNHEGGA